MKKIKFYDIIIIENEKRKEEKLMLTINLTLAEIIESLVETSDNYNHLVAAYEADLDEYDNVLKTIMDEVHEEIDNMIDDEGLEHITEVLEEKCKENKQKRAYENMIKVVKDYYDTYHSYPNDKYVFKFKI